jgi:hypothetical protein
MGGAEEGVWGAGDAEGGGRFGDWLCLGEAGGEGFFDIDVLAGVEDLQVDRRVGG